LKAEFCQSGIRSQFGELEGMVASIKYFVFEFIVRFFGSLSLENRKKLAAFCDVDVNKVGTVYHQPYTNLRV
jgi:hypothetical protein